MIATFDFILRRADSMWCLDAFIKAKDTRFVADWLKSKGLHKLYSVFEGIQAPFVLSSACKGAVYLTMFTYTASGA